MNYCTTDITDRNNNVEGSPGMDVHDGSLTKTKALVRQYGINDDNNGEGKSSGDI